MDQPPTHLEFPISSVDLARVVAAFGQVMHQAGVPVTPERSARFAQVVLLADPLSLSELAALGRTTLLSDHDQIEIFDRVFAQVFGGIIDQAEFRGDSPHEAPPSARPEGDEAPRARDREGSQDVQPSGSSGESDPDGEPDDDEEAVLAAVSSKERLGEKNFADCSEDELMLLHALIARLPFVAPMRTARRMRRHDSGNALDIRATLRASHRTSGDPVRRILRKRTTRPRRVVLIADVSGSMEPYSRVYLHLMRGAVKALGSEAFVFATRLTRLTRPLRHTHPDIAYARAAAAAPDWSGGTRIGTAIKTFLDEYGRRGMARGAVVVIVSDGWELEDPELLGRAMQQLSRLAFHVIWVNPRKAATGYQPLVGGMAAALPYVDTFVSGHSLRALAEVMEAIRDATVGGRHHAYASPVRLPEAAVEEAIAAAAPAASPEVAASQRSRDIFPTGRLVSG
jgi:uncharacterized protein with von Willebrand factor type A (vWA) domain